MLSFKPYTVVCTYKDVYLLTQSGWVSDCSFIWNTEPEEWLWVCSYRGQRNSSIGQMLMFTSKSRLHLMILFPLSGYKL